jgi:hypothetical protein
LCDFFLVPPLFIVGAWIFGEPFRRLRLAAHTRLYPHYIKYK